MMILQGAILRAPARDAAQRRLLRALALSVAAHVLVLWPASLPHVPLQLAQPMTATLRERPPQADGSAAERKAQPAPAATPPRRADPPRRAARSDAKPVLLARAPPRARRAKREPRPPVETVQAVTASSQKAEPMAAAAVASDIGGGPASRAVAAENSDGADADALRQYRFAVSRAARTEYPRLAVERGWTGTAQVRVFIDADGRVRRVSLSHTSGHALLDAKAQTIIGLAAEATALPAALLGNEFSVDFPVEFRLEDSIAQR